MRRIGRVDVFMQRFRNGRQCTLSERLGEVIRACRQARWQSFPNYQLSTTKLAAAQGPGRLAGSFSGGVVGAYTDTPPSHDGTEGQDQRLVATTRMNHLSTVS